MSFVVIESSRLHLISQQNTITRLAPRLPSPLKERRDLERFVAAFAQETRPTPLPSQRLYRPVSVPNGALAPFALGVPQANMACLAIRMAFVDREALTRGIQGTRGGARQTWRQEGVPTLRTEEVLLVICSLAVHAKRGVVEGDITFFHDRGFAGVTLRRESLMIIQMTPRLPLRLIATHMLQQLITRTASEASRVPPRAHRVDDPPQDGPVARRAH